MSDLLAFALGKESHYSINKRKQKCVNKKKKLVA